jgi:hypothetical protein
MKDAVFTGILALLLLNSSAFADGFRCLGSKTGLKIATFNQTEASLGTRTPAILVVSDPSGARGNRTIASFSGDPSSDGTLEYQGYGSYTATVASFLAGSSRGERFVAGTKLADLETINLTVDFSYASGTVRLARVTESIPAKIAYQKRTGEVVEETASCVRYLKHSS